MSSFLSKRQCEPCELKLRDKLRYSLFAHTIFLGYMDLWSRCKFCKHQKVRTLLYTYGLDPSYMNTFFFITPFDFWPLPNFLVSEPMKWTYERMLPFWATAKLIQWKHAHICISLRCFWSVSNYFTER